MLFRSIGRSAARFDTKKLDSLNGHYIREMDDAALTAEMVAFAERQNPALRLDDAARQRLRAAMPMLKTRAKTLIELTEKAEFLFTEGARAPDAAALALLTPEARARMGRLSAALSDGTWDAHALEERARAFAEREGVKLGDIAQPLRAALTGRAASPPIFEVMAVLGPSEALTRIRAHVD